MDCMDNIKAVLFDIDGTLLDTREFIIQATEHALQMCGYPVVDRETISKTVGEPFPKYYHLLAGDKADTNELINFHRDFQFENLPLSIPFKNSIYVLKKLIQRGYKLAAVTTRHSNTSHLTLKGSGIFDMFNAVITIDMVPETKPDPIPLFRALDILQEKPEQAVMIGDSHLDIQAGKNAGTRTIRATYGFHKDNLHNPEPDFFINDIEELLDILK